MQPPVTMWWLLFIYLFFRYLIFKWKLLPTKCSVQDRPLFLPFLLLVVPGGFKEVHCETQQSSPDVFKTNRVWFEKIAVGQQDLRVHWFATTFFFLGLFKFSLGKKKCSPQKKRNKKVSQWSPLVQYVPCSCEDGRCFISHSKPKQTGCWLAMLTEKLPSWWAVQKPHFLTSLSLSPVHFHTAGLVLARGTSVTLQLWCVEQTRRIRAWTLGEKKDHELLAFELGLVWDQLPLVDASWIGLVCSFHQKQTMDLAPPSGHKAH